MNYWFIFLMHGISETLLPGFNSNSNTPPLVLINFTPVTKDGRELEGWSENSQLLTSLPCFLAFLRLNAQN